MIIADTFTINAPQQKVWDFLLDIESLSTCVPGAESVTQTGENTYEGVLTAKVGPLSASFSGVAEITEQVPPDQIKADFRAKDKRTASMVKGSFSSQLNSVEANVTEVSYEINVAIRGKMGQFGQTVIKDTAKSVSAIFVSNVRERLEEPQEGDEGPAASEPAQQPNIVWVVIKSVFASIGRSIKGIFSRSQPANQE